MTARQVGPATMERPKPPAGSTTNLPSHQSRRRPVSSRTTTLAWYAFAAALAVVVLLPIALYFERAFDDNAVAIRNVLDSPGLLRVLLTTVGLAASSTLMAAVLAVGLAALAMRVPQRYRGLAAFVPQIPLVIPPVALIIGWIFIFSPRIGYGNTLLRDTPLFDNASEGPVNIFSVPGIILITGIELTGIVFAFVYARMNEVSGALAAAARLSGASSFRSFITITLPLLRPALVAGMVVSFLLGLGQFTAPLLLGTRVGIEVLTTEVFQIRQAYPIDYAATAALGLPLLIVGIISIVVQRRVVGDQRKYVAQGAGRGMAPPSSRLALILILGYGFVTVVLPVAALALVGFSPYWNGDLQSLTFTTDNVRATLENPAVPQSVINSILLSVLAALVVIPIGFIVALAMSGVVKAPRALNQIFDFIFVAPLAVPRAMLGMTILYVFIRPPFSLYGTFALFVIGYAFIVLPFALRAQYNSLVGVHSSLFEASRVCGASVLATVWRIALPLTKRGITAAVAVMVLLLSHDFAVSVMLRTPGQQVMGTLLLDLWETSVVPQVAVMALVMTFTTAALLAVTLWIGGKSALENL